MEIWEAIQSRRSIRRFRPDAIPEEVLRKLVLDAAIWAPTAGNAQTWGFAIVTDPNLIRKIMMVSPGLLSKPTPALIAVCQDLDEAEKRGGELGRNLTSMDTAMAAQNIMLAAYAQDIGTCAIASFHPGAVQQILCLPPAIVPQLLISLGYPQVKAHPRKRNVKVVWLNEYSRE